jgi:hypothetical protein
MQHHAPDQLYVKVPHHQSALSRFTHDSKRLGQQVVKRLSVGEPLSKLTGLRF